MFNFWKRYAVVFSNAEFTGVMEFYFSKASADAAKVISELLALTKPTMKDGAFTVVKTDKITRSKGTISDGWISYS